jgi:hypothetical protein
VIDEMKKLSSIAQPIEGFYPLEMIRNAMDEALQQCQQNVPFCLRCVVVM